MNKKNNQTNEWQEWNKLGFIPGENESEEVFQQRIDFCYKLKNQFAQILGVYFPFKQVDQRQLADILEDILPFTQRLYGIEPHWVPIFFDNYHLAPWHGGCAWIFQLDNKTPTAAFLQLRACFRHFSCFLGMYRRRELIAHEFAHVGRMLYQDPEFEEIMAYQSASSRWRRWFGPILQSSKESFVFVLLLILVIIVNFCFFFLEINAMTIVYVVNFLPLTFIIWALSRLTYRHKIFNRCLKNLGFLYPPSKARHLLYRLSDREIKLFSQLTPFKIKEFIDHKSDHSFRWNFLKSLYPP